MASSHKVRSHCCFNEWMQLQEQDLNELVQTLPPNTSSNNNINGDSEIAYARLTQKSLHHFEEYMQKRSNLYHEDASAYFAPTWNSSLENSSLWIGGCRPSMFFRLLYAHTGPNVESFVSELMQGTINRESSCCGSSTTQLAKINNLHIKTIKEEDRMSTKLASLQEDVVDQPISVVVAATTRLSPVGIFGEPSREVERVLDEHDAAMATVLYEADNLRLNTLKELLGMLTPEEDVDFLAAGKKMHLSIHEWGKRRDYKHGR